jgi:hypothetical protein
MRLKPRLDPPMAVATVALFVALGGTSYAVGTQINGGNLKNRSVAGAKLKKHTVSATEVNVSKFPKVPAARHADEATHAAKATSATDATNAVNAANASEAANAVHASSATEAGTVTGTVSAAQISGAVPNAANAGHAADAGSVEGHGFTQINASAGSGQATTLVSGFGGLTLQCIAPSGTSGNVTLRVVNSSPDGGTFGAGAVEDGTSASAFKQGPTAGATGGVPQTTDFTFDIPAGGGGAQFSFSYKGASGIVSGTFTMILNNGCSAFGNAEASVA